MPSGVYERTAWHIERLKNRRPHYKPSDETKRRMSQSHLGIRPSEETREKLRLAKLEKPLSSEQIERIRKIGKSNRGKKASAETRQKQRIAATGVNNSQWRTDRTKLKRSGDSNKDRRSSAYVIWRKNVWKRDEWKCKIANADCVGRIEAHHIRSYTKYPESRYDLNNGITLCHFHHPRKRDAEIKLVPYFQDLITTSTQCQGQS